MKRPDSAAQFEFTCSCCGMVHRGLPIWVPDVPMYVQGMSDAEREVRCRIERESCVVDGEFFFVRGEIELPIHDWNESFLWGAWVSLSAASFQKWSDSSLMTQRAHIGPFFGWLNTWLPGYPDSENLKTSVHLRDNGLRPLIELEPTDHPLAVEQQQGITLRRARQLCEELTHAH